ncbi:hypothetical protein [Draconibacterium mangrovi]|uniref:hypothetical protein n=1 Tax=Draconibacterium mangrovi TaxID=2697469 RepID=UPI0013D057AF|nr:hypothetical protein [Draconibacterium mangrovi]
MIYIEIDKHGRQRLVSSFDESMIVLRSWNKEDESNYSKSTFSSGHQRNNKADTPELTELRDRQKQIFLASMALLKKIREEIREFNFEEKAFLEKAKKEYNEIGEKYLGVRFSTFLRGVV